MSHLDPAQLAIARVLFELPEAAGYALAGGGALVANGTIDRPTRDIDAFIEAQPTEPPGDVTPLKDALTTTLEANGWTIRPIREHQTFSRLHATRRDNAIEIDLAVDSPRLFPTAVIDNIPVLDPRDLAAARSSPSSIAPKAATSPTSKRSNAASIEQRSSNGSNNSMPASLPQRSLTPSDGSDDSTTSNSQRLTPPDSASSTRPGPHSSRPPRRRSSEPYVRLKV